MNTCLQLAYIIFVFLTAFGKISASLLHMKYQPMKDIENSIEYSVPRSTNKPQGSEYIILSKFWKSDESIVCKINYDKFWHLDASWSYNASHADYSPGLFLVDYAQYADSFKEFIKRYPTVTVVTYGKAVSPATIGDVGKNKFGTFIYSTSLFTADKNIYYEELVKASARRFFVYDVSVNIGLGFMSRGTTLRMAPYIDGYIVSHGAYERTLDFGLNVAEITFNPK